MTASHGPAQSPTRRRARVVPDWKKIGLTVGGVLAGLAGGAAIQNYMNAPKVADALEVASKIKLSVSRQDPNGNVRTDSPKTLEALVGANASTKIVVGALTDGSLAVLRQTSSGNRYFWVNPKGQDRASYKPDFDEVRGPSSNLLSAVVFQQMDSRLGLQGPIGNFVALEDASQLPTPKGMKLELQKGSVVVRFENNKPAYTLGADGTVRGMGIKNPNVRGNQVSLTAGLRP